jgi:UDP-N-acetylmuramate dehydrogenase
MHADMHAPLAPLTTLELGGPARRLVRLEAPEDIRELAEEIGDEFPVVLGTGSNIIVSDDGFEGTVALMRVTGLRFQREGEHVLATVQAGHSLDAFVGEAVASGLSGVEMLTGIPGLVGATPIQNVGAYGQEVAESIVEVDAYDWALRKHVTLGAAECNFGHRTSLFKHVNRWIILRVTFALTPSKDSCPLNYRAVAETAGVAKGERAPITEAATAVRDVRTKKGMILYPDDPDHRSVGSVFLSPVIDAAMAERMRSEGAPVNSFPDGTTRVSASWLIKEAGFSLAESLAPGVRMSSKHFTLVVHGDASALSFAEASDRVARQVMQRTGVRLTAEPDLIGPLPTYQALTGRSA